MNVSKVVAQNAIQSIRRKSGGTLIGAVGGGPGGGGVGGAGFGVTGPGLGAPGLPAAAADSDVGFLGGILLLIVKTWS